MGVKKMNSGKRIYSNRAKAICFGAIALILYLIPLTVLAIYNWDRLFVDKGTGLTLFAVLIIIFFLFFAKKLVKQICGVITLAGFASLIMLIVSLVIKTFVDDLFIISVASLIGAVLAWYPTQVATVFNDFSKDDKGNLRSDLDVKTVNNIIFGFFID